MSKLCLGFLFTIVAINGYQGQLKRFSYKDCGPNDPLKVNSVAISPDPIVSPGIVNISVSISGIVNITSPTEVHVKLQKSIWGVYVDVPCKDIGGCDYPDLCASLEKYFPPDKPCPGVFLENNLPCNCPIPAGNYQVNGLQIPLNASVPKIAIGDYHAIATLSQEKEMHCSEIYFSIGASRSGSAQRNK